MALDLSKFLARFVEEARDHCAKLSEGLLNLEQAADRTEAIHALFRSAHTIKGSARMLKLTGVSELAHSMEDVLDALRSGRIPFTPALADALFRGVDALLPMLDQCVPGAQPEAPAALCRELEALGAGSAPAMVPPAEPGPAPAAPAQPEAAPAPVADPGPAAAKAEYLRIRATKLDDLIQLMGEMVSEHGRFRREILHLRELDRTACQWAGTDSPRDRAHLESLAALHESVRMVKDAVMMQDHLIAELQETTLTMRMLPLSTVFDPLRRTVRDLAREHGKEIDFQIDGGETELDRKIIEQLGDPLVHMIRNGLDHGLEGPEERRQAGKPERGSLRLSACYEGGCVIIALRDDGRGIDTEKLKAKVLATRLRDPETLERMSRAEVLNLIFLPGLSTSPVITDLSGRGVGMDVVRKNIVEGLKGTITIETQPGAGTTFHLRLPLNLAIFPLFLVALGARTCAIPTISIVEMLAVAPEEIVEFVGRRTIRRQDRTLPVEDLASLLGLPPQGPAAAGKVSIVIVHDGADQLGFIVSDILSREELVVKPVPLHLKNLKLVNGVTVGTGNQVINVLDVPELMKAARHAVDPVQVPAGRPEQRRCILVVDDSMNTREIEKDILEAKGYDVETAEDGQDALEKTRRKHYDLVLTDVEMPRMDGFALTERLRADEHYQTVPVIIVTSLAKPEDRMRGIQVGADAYLLKNAFDQSSLVDTVRNLIG
jgi:chemotaxis protein histidine kinase CheA/CheY-like chemotaxis protein